MNKRYTLLLNTFLFVGVHNLPAMEQDVVNKSKLFELFKELPADLKREIIIAAAKIGTLQEAVCQAPIFSTT